MTERERLAEAVKAKRDDPVVRRAYPCGCVSCVCEDEARCNGCGAKSCGNQDVAHLATPTASPEPLPFGCVAHECKDHQWLVRSSCGKFYWGPASCRWAEEPNNFAHGLTPFASEAVSMFHSTNGGKVPPPDSDAGRGSDMAKKKWPRCEDCGNELTYCGPMSIDGPKADCPLCQSRDKTRAAEARATAAEERCKRLEDALRNFERGGAFCDTNPTVMFGKGEQELAKQYVTFIERIDQNVRMCARTALSREGEKA